ncbi:MAG: aldehyde dehydrogenase family protein [Planctomycetota bacterium]
MQFQETQPLYLAGQPHQAGESLTVTDKHTGAVLAQVSRAGASEIETAIAAAAQAAPAMAALPVYRRQAILAHCVTRMEQRAEELTTLLMAEAGKVRRDAEGEVTRLIDTFRVAHSEVTRPAGEVLSMDVSSRAEGTRGLWKRVPLGPLSFITPFNFPLNLVAHKVAPAIAAGCPFVLKPASLTPLGALAIGSILAETELPPGAFSILPCDRAGADALTTDERLKLLSFTGSPAVGWQLKQRAGKKKVVLELGGNAACIVDETADLAVAVPRLATGAFSSAGQSCISVQRILVHRSRWAELREALLAEIGQWTFGAPEDPATRLAPMISAEEAQRAEMWVQEALGRGARRLCGGPPDGARFAPTLLEDVPHDCRIYREEVFAPVALLEPFDDFDAALERVNDSDFGLQAGVFTRELDRAMAAWDRLEVGGVIVGDVPSWRVDHMPYGGVKDSGLGREGVRYAIEDMTEMRLLVLRGPG